MRGARKDRGTRGVKVRESFCTSAMDFRRSRNLSPELVFKVRDLIHYCALASLPYAKHLAFLGTDLTTPTKKFMSTWVNCIWPERTRLERNFCRRTPPGLASHHTIRLLDATRRPRQAAPFCTSGTANLVNMKDRRLGVATKEVKIV